MKRSAMWLVFTVALSFNMLFAGCGSQRKTGTIAKSSAVPVNKNATDSAATGPKITPVPIPNVRPNPIPNPAPPNPPM